MYQRIDQADEKAFQWIQASASMPIVSRPVAIDGGEYLDGGLSDAIPLRYFESLGYDRNVVITTRPRGYRKPPEGKLRLWKLFLRRLPKVCDAMQSRSERYNASLDYLDSRVQSGQAFLIAPEQPLEISRISHDPDQMQRVYDTGRTAGERNLSAILEFLSRSESKIGRR